MDTFSNALYKIWLKISRPAKATFFSASIIGFLAHVTFMTNRFFNHDSIFYTIMNPQNTEVLQQGKWLNQIALRLIQGDITTAGIMVPIAILFLALTAAFTVSILKIQSPVWAAVIGAFTVLFPSVMCANIFLSSAIFFSALLLATLAVFFTLRFRHGYLLGMLLLTMSCGIYSVFIGYAAGLFMMVLMLGLLDNKMTIKQALLSGLKYIAVLAVSAVLYYVVLNILLRVNHVPLSEYRGINQIGMFSLSSLANVIRQSHTKVLYFFVYGIFLYTGSYTIEPLFHYLNWATMFFAGAFSLSVAIHSGSYKRIIKIALVVALAFIFPLAIHAIGILGKNAYTHWIMVYPFVLVYIYMVASADRIETAILTHDSTDAPKKKGAHSLLRAGTIAALILCLLLIRQWYFTTNQSYEYMRYTDANTYAAGVMLTDDIRQADGYDESVLIALVGGEAPDTFQYNTSDFVSVHGQLMNGYTGFRNPIVDHERLKALLRNWVGVSFPYADDETAQKLSGLSEVAAMPIYPAQGSIAMVDGFLVVKLSETASTPAG